MSVAEQRGIRAILIAVGLLLLAAGATVAIGSYVAVNPHAPLHPQRAEREELMAWLARILFFLGALWIAIGAISARTRLVRRPGAAAARATWLSFSRPWRARESMLGLLPLDRWLMVCVPAGLIIATHLVGSSFLSILPVLLASTGWFVFVLVCIAIVWPRSPWPVIAAVSGTAVVFSLVVLAGIAVWGPGTYWLMLWNTPWLRFLVLIVAIGVMAWAMIAAGGAMTQQVGAGRATGVVLCAAGATIIVEGLVPALVGPAWLGAQWLDETVRLVFAPWTVWVIVAVGVVTMIAGVVVIGLKRKPVAAT